MKLLIHYVYLFFAIIRIFEYYICDVLESHLNNIEKYGSFLVHLVLAHLVLVMVHFNWPGVSCSTPFNFDVIATGTNHFWLRRAFEFIFFTSFCIFSIYHKMKLWNKLILAAKKYYNVYFFYYILKQFRKFKTFNI